MVTLKCEHWHFGQSGGQRWPSASLGQVSQQSVSSPNQPSSRAASEKPETWKATSMSATRTIAIPSRLMLPWG